MSEARRDVVSLAPARSPSAPSYDGDKPADEIELDIARTRIELGTTLKTLERKLMPEQVMGQILGQISEKGVDMLKETMEGDFTRIAERIRENPLPAALIGAGIGWLLLSSTSGKARGVAERAAAAADAATQRGASDLSYARQKLGDAAGYIGEEARRLSQSAVGAVGEMMHGDVGERAKDYVHRAGDQASRLGERASAVIEEHPLVVGGLGLIAGLLIGMALPARHSARQESGEVEEEWYVRRGGTMQRADPVAAQTSRASPPPGAGGEARPGVAEPQPSGAVGEAQGAGS